jgi:hypothetical protein
VVDGARKGHGRVVNSPLQPVTVYEANGGLVALPRLALLAGGSACHVVLGAAGGTGSPVVRELAPLGLRVEPCCMSSSRGSSMHADSPARSAHPSLQFAHDVVLMVAILTSLERWVRWEGP